jgi:c-di-GMP-binding flagellar brake protein YcgR
MTEQEFKLQPGDTLQLTLYGDETRHFVKVIGYLTGQSLLISTPRIKGQAMLLREGQLVTVRLLSGGTVYAFETQILRASLTPYPYLHLVYPKEFESTVVRKAQRASAHVIASVENTHAEQTSPQPAMIADMSTAGAMLESKRPLGKAGDDVVINVKLMVGNIERYVSVGALIRNVREKTGDEHSVFQHGVEFQLLSTEEQLILHGFVYEQIAQGNAA